MMHQGLMSKPRANSSLPIWVRQRELRQRLPLGHSDVFYKSLYSSISPCHSWGEEETSRSEQVGLFSLEFSQDGTLLVAGCEDNSILIFEPSSRKLIRTVHDAHENTVTNVKFLDSRIFATGSVDQKVSLWDTRNLKSPFQTLQGHSNMVGNIEFSRKNEMLITSGLDGIIYLWDMKKWNQRGELYKNTFRSHVLLRLRLNPDASKIIFSTASGYLLIVHELDLNTFCEDLDEFALDRFVNLYSFQANTLSDYDSSRFLFPNRRRNRVEIVADFPNAGGFHMISALEIHPQGWSVFSRSKDEESGEEWTCVHDIQEQEGWAALQGGSEDEHPPCPHQNNARRAEQHSLEWIDEEQWSPRGDMESTEPSSNDSDSELPNAALSLERGARRRRSGSPAGTDRTRRPLTGSQSLPPGPFELAGLGSNPDSSSLLDSSLFPRPNSSVAQFNRRVYERFPRLTHYIEEPPVHDLYISNLGVSADGRLVCSPLDRCIRLLAFSPECSEQSVSWCGTRPRLLYELGTHISHSDSVLCTKFSPRHCLLVSGCLDGKLAWYQPVL